MSLHRSDGTNINQVYKIPINQIAKVFGKTMIQVNNRRAQTKECVCVSKATKTIKSGVLAAERPAFGYKPGLGLNIA